MGTFGTRRRPGSLILAAALIAAFFVFPATAAHAATPTQLTAESFTGSSVSDPNWKTGGTAFSSCLTSSTATTQTPIPGCANGAVALPSGGDASGSGTLRLTENVGNQVGYALYDVPLPFTKGLQITFDQYQYAGSGADGIGFFLADGSATTFAPGQPGGSFGYAQRSGLVGTPSGYLGLALDSYGNFANDNENRGTNCTATEGKAPDTSTHPDTVTLRGPGSGLNKYCWLATSAKLNPSLRTAGPTRAAAKTKQGMRITIDPSTNKVTVERNMYDGNGYATVLTTNMPPSPPSTVKFGFLASTGGSNDIHEINNVSITSLQQLAALQTTIAPASSSYVSGTTGSLNIGVSSVSTEGAGNSAVNVKSTLPAGITLNGTPTGTNWDCSASSGQNVSCVRTGTVFYTAGTTFPTISVPVTFSSTSSATSYPLSSTAYSSDAAPDYGNNTVNVTPLAVNDTYTAVGGAATTMSVLSNDKGSIDPTSVSITTPSPNGTASVNATTGVVTFTSASGFSGATSFTYQVKDTSGQATTAVANITVTPKAYADAVSTTVNTAITHNPLANDFGNFTTSTLAITTAPTHGTAAVQSGGLIKYTPAANYSGTDTLTYKITDAGGTSTTAVVTYTIAPTAADDTALTTVNTAKAISVLGNDVGSLTKSTLTVTTAPGHGTTSVNTTTGVITYTPTTDWSGVDTFVYRISDGTTPVTATATVTVTPTAAADTATTTAGTAVSTNVLANDHGSLAPASVSVTTAPLHGTTSVNTTTGAVTYTPAANWSGTDTYTYTATDGAGQPVTQTVTVTVTPTAAPDSLTRSVTAGGPITFTPLSNDVGSLSNSTFAFSGATVFTTSSWDPTTGTLTVTQPGGSAVSGTWTQGYKICDTSGSCVTSSFTLTVTPLAVADSATTAYATAVPISVLTNDAGSMTKASLTVTGAAAHGTTSVNTTTGVITYTPAANWSGVDTFTYRGSDGTTTSSAVVTVTTTPKAFADTATTTGRTPVAVDVLANDKGVINASTVSVTTAPTVGTTSVNGTTGVITYTAPANYSGTQTFTYTVNDTNGSPTSATVTITVKPNAQNDSATTPAGTAVTVPILANDDATAKVSTIVVTGFTHGTTSLNATTGDVTYTPAAGWSGDETGTVSYTDTSGQATTSQLAITTTPTAAADTASTSEHTAVSIPVLSNDHGTFVTSSVTVPASGVGHPAHGTTTVNTTTGAITYTPTAGFSGTDTFSYTVTDGAGRTAGASVTVTVSPTLVNDTATTDSVTSVDTDVLANDKGSIDPLTLTAPATSTHGGTVQVVGGKVRYTPLHTFSGTDTVTYTVSDTSSQSRSATLTITVTPLATDDVATAGVSAPNTTTDVVANDNGDLDPTTVAITVPPAHGTTSIDPTTGAITFHGAAGWSGKDVLTYKVCDHSAQCTTAKLNVTITPQSGPVSTTTPVNVAVALDPTTGQTGTFDRTTVAVTTPPTHGTVTVDPVTGTLTYTPTTDWSGTDSFTYTIKDEDGQLITVVATVGVVPTAANDTATTTVDTAVDVTQLANDHGTFTSVDAPALALTNGATPHGTVSVNPDLSLHYTPNAGFSGTDTINYIARDAAGHSVSAIVTVSVTPGATNDSATSTGHQPVTVDVLGNDHGTFVPSTVTVPSSGPSAPNHGTVSIDPSNGAVTYTPGANWSGTDTFTYTACDAAAQCATATVSILTTPESSDDHATTTSVSSATTTVLANDHGTFDPATVTVTTPAAHGTTSVDVTTGKVTYTPDAGWSGQDGYTYSVTDQEGRIASAHVVVDVSPVATDDSVVTTVDTALAVGVLANDHGTFDPSTVTVTVAPDHGTTSVDPATGAVTYTPTSGWTGNDSFTYRACDAAAACATAHVAVHVGLTAGDDLATTTTNHDVVVDVLANDHGSLVPSSVNVTSAPTHGVTVVNPTTGAITLEPTHDWSGNDTFDYQVCDATPSCVTATVTVHVSPTAANDHDGTTANTAVTTDVLANDHGTLQPGSVTVSTAPDHGTTAVDGTTGAITYTPTTDWSGTDTYAYTVTDGAGRTATATVTVDVSPTAVADVTTTPANQAVGIDVRANDHGSLTAGSVTVGTPAQHGTATVDTATGIVTYLPAHDWSGDDTFGYSVCDAVHGCTGAHVTVHVTPVADDDTATAVANQPVDIDVLANDHGTLDPTTVAVSAPPAHGTTSVDPTTGVVTYTPDHDWSGADTFSYTATDGAGESATAQVTVGTGVVADDDTATTDSGQATTVDVLGNDHGVLVPGSVSVTTDPGHGSTTVDPADGSVTYTPDNGWSGDDTFAYTVCDATPTCSTAHVHVTVAPTAGDDHESTAPGTPVVSDVLANDHGTLVDSSVAIVTAPAHGTTSIDPATGKITYTPALSFSGTDTIVYSVKDTAGQVATATLTVDVGLVAHDDSGTTPVGTPVTVDVVANDDGTPDASSVTVTTAPTHGTTSIDPATGKITYTPQAHWSGTDAITYQVCDSSSNCSSADVHLVVTPVADADAAGTDTVAGAPVVVDVLGNDEGDLVASSVVVTGHAGHGATSVDPTTGKVTYTPDDDWSGVDTFTYKVCDATPSCATALVTVNVAPTSSDDTATTSAGHTVVIDVRHNDKGTLDPSATTVVTPPAHGTATVNTTTGTIGFTPASGWSGTDTFTYSTCDALSHCSQSAVTVTVAPTAADDHGLIRTGTGVPDVAVDTRPNDHGSFDPGATTITGAPAHGTATVDADGVVTYTPTPGFMGTDTVGYSVCDTSAQCVSADVTVVVEGITVTTSTRCVRNAPYVDYAITPVAFSPSLTDHATVTWLETDGATVSTLTGQPLHGSLLWPGVKLDHDGNAIAWPGWKQSSNGTWIRYNDPLRPSLKLHFAMGPAAEVTVAYPAPTAACAAAPHLGGNGSNGEADPGSSPSPSDRPAADVAPAATGPGGLAHTGSDVSGAAEFALSLLFAGFVLVVVTRRRRSNGAR